MHQQISAIWLWQMSAALTRYIQPLTIWWLLKSKFCNGWIMSKGALIAAKMKKFSMKSTISKWFKWYTSMSTQYGHNEWVQHWQDIPKLWRFHGCQSQDFVMDCYFVIKYFSQKKCSSICWHSYRRKGNH